MSRWSYSIIFKKNDHTKNIGKRNDNKSSYYQIIDIDTVKVKMVSNKRYFLYLIRKETIVSTIFCSIKITESSRRAYICLFIERQLEIINALYFIKSQGQTDLIYNI